jgi:hypothetical protein
MREREREREREKRKRNHVWTDETEGLKRLIEYTKMLGLFHGI